MLQRMPKGPGGSNDGEQGYTLIEVLVVVVVIGVLAAIALPVFVVHQGNVQDADARSDVRNAVTQIEACLTDAANRSGAIACSTTSNEGLAKLGLVFAPGAPARRSSLVGGSPVYSVGAVSKTNHTFTIAKVADGDMIYRSSPADPRWDANSTTAGP